MPYTQPSPEAPAQRGEKDTSTSTSAKSRARRGKRKPFSPRETRDILAPGVNREKTRRGGKGEIKVGPMDSQSST